MFYETALERELSIPHKEVSRSTGSVGLQSGEEVPYLHCVSRDQVRPGLPNQQSRHAGGQLDFPNTLSKFPAHTRTVCSPLSLSTLDN